MSVSLRLYAPEDFDVLYEIDQSCFARGIAYSRRTLRWFLTQPGAECLIAEHQGTIVGFILSQASGRDAQIVTLDVAPAGRRRGIGSLLLQEAERRLCAAGVRYVTLETATNNDAAVAFWDKHDYRTEAVVKNYYLDKLDAFVMRKALTDLNGQNPRRRIE